jgi:anthranilate phosphoribosyltransferase
MIDEDDKETDFRFDPAEVAMVGFHLSELSGGDAAENAAMARSILAGRGFRAIRAACVLNAGAALMVAGLACSISQGCQMAENALDSGSVKRKLEAVIEKSRLLGEANGC